jgi:hypothetical protein
VSLGPDRRERRIGLGDIPMLLAAALVVAAIAACQPSAPPGFTGSVPPEPGVSSAPAPSAGVPGGSLVAGKPVVTLDGTTVTIQGLGNGTSPDFELPAGSAKMTVSVCPSNQVIPFVTLYDATDTKLGIIVDAEYTLTNLAGGAYYVEVASNPTCVWTIQIAPV